MIILRNSPLFHFLLLLRRALFAIALLIPIITIILSLSCRKDDGPCLTCPPPGPDTTSHNFTWQIDTLGDGSASVLNDVVIINDTLAYAVGEIYLRDSLGNWDPDAYNAAKWNGTLWELKRIPFIGPCSAVNYPPIKAIWAFSYNNILVTNGGSIVRYDGTNAVLDCGMNSLLTGAINKIYAANPQNVYAVGNAGTIVYYNGATWQSLASGTTVDIQDIWGATANGQTEILAVASYSIQVPQAKALLKISGTTVSPVSDQGLPLELESIWFVPQQQYYVCGNGAYYTFALGQPWQADTRQPAFYKYSVRGLALNDIVMVGGFGYVSHFNGLTAKLYTPSEIPSFFGNYYSVALHPKLLCAVGGYEGRKGVVLLGRR